MSEPDDIVLEWVTLALQGNQDAFAELVYTYQDAVFNLCYRMLSNRTEAEDATQEAFLRAFTKLSAFDQNRSFKTWLLSIASNHCIDRLRKRRMTYLSLDDEPVAATLALSSDDPLPEYAALRQERSEHIQELLGELAPDYRLPVVLRYWYDYSYAEIAEAMETSESAIKSRLHRARKMLADKLGDTPASSSGYVNPLLEEL